MRPENSFEPAKYPKTGNSQGPKPCKGGSVRCRGRACLAFQQKFLECFALGFYGRYFPSCNFPFLRYLQ